MFEYYLSIDPSRKTSRRCLGEAFEWIVEPGSCLTCCNGLPSFKWCFHYQTAGFFDEHAMDLGWLK
jgi:hypothetical protein